MKALRFVAKAGAAVLLLGAAALAFSLWRSIPPLGGQAQIPNLTGAVTVTHDVRGIPYIAAGDDLDAFRALGFLHARDRLWEMEMLRHAALGRLSEMLGAATIDTDRYLRELEIGRIADAAEPMLAPATRAVLAAYAEGVNAAIARLPGGRPLELRLLRHRPEPWTAVHSIAIGRLQAWDLASTANAELQRTRAVAVAGLERVAALDLPDPIDIVILPPGSGTWVGRAAPGRGGRSQERTALPTRPTVLLAADAIPEVPAAVSEILAGLSWAHASNSWVIGPSRTRSGKPILANDPHLALRAPALWYLAAIASPGYRVAGATLPGLPGVVIGRNARIAWGLTNLELDDVDYVIERLSTDSSQVLTAEGWVPVEVRLDTIMVKGRAPVPVTLRRTPHGPLIRARADVVGAADAGEVRALAMRWTGQEPSDELAALLGVNRAGTWEAFLEAVSLWRAPEQNWIYADVDGNIGYTASGRVPVRRSGRGRLPTAGWTGEGGWERYLDFEELPRAFNPPEGFIVTANNRVVGPEYPHPFDAEFALPWRAARIRELILADSQHTAAGVRRMQMDSVDLFARRAKGVAAAAATAAGRVDLAARLEAWDGTMGADRSEPTLFAVWYQALRRLTFEDEFGGWSYAPSVPVHHGILNGGSPWFDDRRTAVVEDLAAIAERAMREALPVADSLWGAVHVTVSEHLLGGVPILNRLLRLNSGPRARAGSGHTVNVAGYGGERPWRNTHAASLRQVVDLAAPDSGTLVITTGQSGHPLSRRYRDQVELWWTGQQLVVPLTAPARGRVLSLVKE